MSDLLRRALGDVPTEDHLGDALLSRYLDGALEGPDRESAERHLGRCPRCTEDLAAAVRVEIEAEALEVTRPRAAPQAARPVARAESSTRTWLRLAAGIALVFGALLLSREAGRLVAGRLEPVLVAQLEEWTERDVTTKGTSLVVSGGPGIEVAGLEITDDPSFSDENFASVERIALHVHPSALLGGRLEGSVELDRPVLRLVRNAGGEWNIETLGGRVPGARGVAGIVRAEVDRALEQAAAGLPPTGITDEPRVQLTSATIDGGILEIEDIGGGGEPLRVQNVNLSYHGIPGRRAALSLDGQLGSEKDRIALRGEVGPFEGSVVPVYRFREVELEAVPVAKIPGGPAAVIGQLTFDGHLESAGRALGEIVAAARGGGEIGLCCGTFKGRNLARDFLERLGELSGGRQLLRAARNDAALASALASADTPYDRLGGMADLDPGTLHIAGLEVDTGLFRADADASIGLEGTLAAEGSIQLSPEVGAILLAAAPAFDALSETDGSIHLPFRASGSWANLQIDLDVKALVARLGIATPPSLLALFRHGGKTNGLWAALASSPG
ncbi:MAG: zf-HC2 domain-containing protein [Candidatus Binatia bacterium]|nr:zf-HC2 domain-containing protein [Candidatus Binatia bacterium]